jgi:hypothetical protein
VVESDPAVIRDADRARYHAPKIAAQVVDVPGWPTADTVIVDRP